MAIDTIKSTAVLDGTIATADIADDAITGAKIENNPTIAGTLGVTGTGGVSGGTAAVAYGDADDLVVGNGSGNRGMSIYTGTSNAGSIYFSDASSGTGQYDGYISYNHNNRTMVAYSGINYGLNIDGVNKTVRLTDGGTQRLRIDNDGIKFGTDSAAVNALDDYEEGTWTPSMGGDTTYHYRTGVYTKVGNKVFIRGQVSINQIGTGDTHKILGLPFTSESTLNGNPAGVLGVSYFANLAIAVTYISGYVESAQSRIQISATGSNAVTTVQYNTGAFFGNGSRLDFSMTYRV